MEVCDPAEGFVLSCIAKNITKAGIRAVTKDYEPSPLVVFIARDHHHMNKKFQNVSENDIIQVKIIGKRYELNDEYISVIGELIN
jgi:CTP synthase (UTP-ammonia lyase)